MIFYLRKKNRPLTEFGLKNPVGENMSEYKKVETDMFRWKSPGDSISGQLVSVEKSGKFDNKVYKIKKGDGKVVSVFGTVILEDLMASIEIGKDIKILYTEDKKATEKGKNDTKMFEVYVKE